MGIPMAKVLGKGCRTGGERHPFSILKKFSWQVPAAWCALQMPENARLFILLNCCGKLHDVSISICTGIMHIIA